MGNVSLGLHLVGGGELEQDTEVGLLVMSDRKGPVVQVLRWPRFAFLLFLYLVWKIEGGRQRRNGLCNIPAH